MPPGAENHRGSIWKATVVDGVTAAGACSSWPRSDDSFRGRTSQGWYAGSVIITGFVGQRTRKTLLEGASVLAYPSLYEEFGFPMLEAMTLGVPVVACDVGPVREVAAGAVRSLIRRMRTRSAWPSSSPSVDEGH